MSTVAVLRASSPARNDETSDSCLVQKLGRYVELTPGERKLLARFEEEPQDFRRRKIVRRQNEEAGELYVLREGWMFSFVILPDGGRQVLDLHFPGDIVGHTSLAFQRSSSGLATVTPCTLCAFPRARLDAIFEGSPRLTALLFATGMMENVVLVDRLKSIGRMEARDRVGHFLLQLHARLQVMDGDIGDTFRMPLSQELIGDALGLSAIHVNRTLRRLQEEGFLKRRGQEVTLPDRDRLATIVDFQDRYYKIETGWFPQ